MTLPRRCRSDDVGGKGRYVAGGWAPIEPARWSRSGRATWSRSGPSTQVPFAARSGVRTPADPRSQGAHRRTLSPSVVGSVEVRLPPRGARRGTWRVTKRPVRPVFTRKEEFFAPDHRREGMTIELETGARRHPRRGRGSPSSTAGAYCGEGGFFADGHLPRLRARASSTTSRSRRSQLLDEPALEPACVRPRPPRPTGRLEQHMDEVAAAIGMIRRARRCNLVAEGDHGPTGQASTASERRSASRGAAPHRVRRLPGREAPDDEAIGVASGWWPLGVPSGQPTPRQRGRHRRHHTGAQENGARDGPG